MDAKEGVAEVEMTDTTLYPRNFERDPNKRFLPNVIAAIESEPNSVAAVERP